MKLASAWQTLPPITYPGFTDDDVMLQGFYWDAEPRLGWWTNLSGKVSDLASVGFTMIWLPPPYKAANAGYSVGYDPFDHYDLGEYYQKYSTPTRYGTKAELTNLLSALIATNMVPVCDIVLNHMAGGSGGDHKTFDYPHNIFEKGSTNFHPSSTGHNDEIFPYHNNENFGTYPPLDIYGVDNDALDPHMRRGLKQWGSWLVTNIHFGGFRFDYTEGVEPWYVWEWLNYPSQRPLFGFMEYWANADEDEMRTWLHLTGWEAAIYDWNLQKLLEEMCEDSGTSFDMYELQAPSLLGIEPDYTVTFVENHDTLQPTNEIGIATNKHLAYAYILHSQGLPLVFYHDYYDQPYYVGGTNYAGVPLKPEIDRLILIRKATVEGSVAYLNTNADLLIQQRDGGGSKPGSILVINDHPSSTLTNQVQTIFTNQWLIDLVSTNPATLIQTDTNGYVNLAAPPRDYRIYGLTNLLTE